MLVEAFASRPDLMVELHRSLGYGGSVDAGSIMCILENAHEVAVSTKPLQEASAQLLSASLMVKQSAKLIEDHGIASLAKACLGPLAALRDLADVLLAQDLVNAETEMCAYYKRLYGGGEFPLKKVAASRTGKTVNTSFLVDYQDTLVEAGPLLNSSRTRALLWSYVFALTKMVSDKAQGEFLGFTIMDEPLTSLDQEHRREFAQIIFGADSHQYIVASHDLRLPRELKWIKGLAGDLQYRSCYGLSKAREVVRVSAWTEGVDEKWAEWKADESNIERGRDYVASVREWVEEELKDLLRWAREPSMRNDTLGDLIQKLEYAGLSYDCKQMQELSDSLKLIETDLQNSHHGCEGRKNIFRNQVEKVHKQMQKIPSWISDIRDLVYCRFNLDTMS
jgi:hypothetical protein